MNEVRRGLSQQVPETQIQELLPGVKVKHKIAGVGTFLGIEKNPDGFELARIQIPDPHNPDFPIDYLIPMNRYGKIFSIYTPEPPKIKQDEVVVDTAVEAVTVLQSSVVRNSPLDNLDVFEEEDRETVKKLKEFLKENQENDAFLVLSKITKETLPHLRVRVAELLHEALEKDYLFRGDGRHPYAQGDLDAKLGIKKGPFEEGFDPGNEYNVGYAYSDIGTSPVEEVAGVYIAPSFLQAAGFPEDHVMPKDWDKTTYVYFIKPDVCIRELVDVKEFFDKIKEHDEKREGVEPEFVLNEIRPEEIVCAIAVSRTGIIKEVFENPLAKQTNTTPLKYLNDMEHIEEFMGTNSGGVFMDRKTGEFLYAKCYLDASQSSCEFIANKIYQAAGVPVLDGFLVKSAASIAYATPFKKDLRILPEKKRIKAQKIFIAACYLLDWDAVGTGPEDPYGNLREDGNGNLVLLDHGGSLLFRGLNGRKSLDEIAIIDVPEIDSMRSDINPLSQEVFSGISDEEIKRQVVLLVTNVTPELINQVVDQSLIKEPEGRFIKELLIKRREALKRFIEAA